VEREVSNLFNTPDEARAYITSLIDAEARRTGMPLDEFERELLAVRSEDSIQARAELAHAHGKEDDGWNAMMRLSSLLRHARHSSTLAPLHPSGSPVTVLVKAAEGCLDRSGEVMWLVVHDGQIDMSEGAQKALVRVVMVVLGITVLGYVGWRAWHIGGVSLLVVVGLLMLVAFAVDRYRLAKRARA
jgi:hypothetical protein